MKSLQELLNESIVNESRYMETVANADIASKEITKNKYDGYITYIGDEPEDAAYSFYHFYDVTSYYTKKEKILLIPVSDDMAMELRDDDLFYAKMSDMGISEEDIEF